MCENQCKSCKYYRQHYALDNCRIFQVFCGHCTFDRVKSKKQDSPACKNFFPKSSHEETFVAKEYLTKELLQYMLRLELLPEIEDKIEENTSPLNQIRSNR